MRSNTAFVTLGAGDEVARCNVKLRVVRSRVTWAGTPALTGAHRYDLDCELRLRTYWVLVPSCEPENVLHDVNEVCSHRLVKAPQDYVRRDHVAALQLEDFVPWAHSEGGRWCWVQGRDLGVCWRPCTISWTIRCSRACYKGDTWGARWNLLSGAHPCAELMVRAATQTTVIKAPLIRPVAQSRAWVLVEAPCPFVFLNFTLRASFGRCGDGPESAKFRE